MQSYQDVLTQVRGLNSLDKLRLLQELKALVNETEDLTEDISADLLAESSSAWQDYLSGIDSGISSQEFKNKIWGDNFD